MEGFIILLVLAFFGFLFLGAVCGFLANTRTHQLNEELDALRKTVRTLRNEVTASTVLTRERKAPTPESAEPSEEPSPTPTPAPASGKPVVPPAPSPAAKRVVPPEPSPVQTQVGSVSPTPSPTEEAAGLVAAMSEQKVEAPSPAPEAPAAPPVSQATIDAKTFEPPAWVQKIVAFFHRPDWVAALEQNVGQRWMTWAGGLAIFAAVAFFLKYAIDQNWINPSLRVAGGVVAGIAILFAGDRFARRGMRHLGLGLIGAAGLPILYVSLYTGFHIYDVLPQAAAFGGMALVTAAGITLAVRHDSLVVSFLSLLGGQLTPILVSTGQDARAVLFSYLLILDLGVLGVSWFRKWRALDVLAFVGTAVLFGAWYGRHYTPEAMLPTLGWLGAFYATFLALPVVYHLRRREALPLERFILTLAVATTTLFAAHKMLFADHRKLLAAVTLVMSASYAVLGVAVRRRLSDDRRSVFAFLTLSVMFATLAPPLGLKFEAITLVWAAEGIVLVVLGYLYAYAPLRTFGTAVEALALGRFFAVHWPLHDGPFRLFLNTEFGIGAAVCAGVAGLAVAHHVWRERANLADAVTKTTSALLAGLLALFLLHTEIGSWFAEHAARYHVAPWYLRLTTGAFVWGLGSVAFVVAGIRVRNGIVRFVGSAALAGAGILLLITYAPRTLVGHTHFGNARFIAALSLIAIAFLHALLLRRARSEAEGRGSALAVAYAIGAGLGLVAALHVETAGWLATHARRFAVSETYMHVIPGVVLWGLGSIAFLATGLRTRHFVTRYVGAVLLPAMALMVVHLYGPGMLDARTYFVNARFGVALLAVAVAFIHCILRHIGRERCAKEEQWLVPACGLAAGLAFLTIVHIELADYVGEQARYAARCWVTLLWLAGWGAFLWAGAAWRSLAARLTSLVALVVAAGLTFSIYVDGLGGDLPCFANARFAVALMVSLAAFAHGWVVRGFREGDMALMLRIPAGVCALLAVQHELVPWLETWGRLAPLCGKALLWTLGSWAYAAAGLRRKVLPWTATGLIGLTVAGILVWETFDPRLGRDLLLLLNGRVLAALVFAAATLWTGLGILRAAADGSGDRTVGILLCWIAAAAPLAAFSADAYGYTLRHVTDPSRARFATQMALSIVWSAYAAVLLAVGFWKRQRPVRFAALGLFAITTAKLLFVDLAAIRQQQVFRILSFLVAGLLMIAASYLYHKLEKYLERVWSEEEALKTGSDEQETQEE